MHRQKLDDRADIESSDISETVAAESASPSLSGACIIIPTFATHRQQLWLHHPRRRPSASCLAPPYQSSSVSSSVGIVIAVFDRRRSLRRRRVSLIRQGSLQPCRHGHRPLPIASPPLITSPPSRQSNRQRRSLSVPDARSKTIYLFLSILFIYSAHSLL